MNEQIIFTTNSTGTITNMHSYEQSNLRQCTVASRHSAVRVGAKYLFVAQSQKALIHVYNAAHDIQRESIEQRLPLPEVVNCLEVVENNVNTVGNNDISGEIHKLPEFNLPYLLIASTESGKLYIWELNSGILLNVKHAAHYQAITKIKSILNGKYIVTSGNDSRIIIWQTIDLVSQEDPKPVAVLQDHTLPITDFEVSSTHGENLLTSGVKLYSASRDATVRCYDLSSLVNQGNNRKTARKSEKVQLLATFSLPYPISCITLDPAERSIYLGTQTGCFALPLYYKLNGNRIANLVQMSDGNRANIYSLVEQISKTSDNQNRDSLYAKGQLICEKLLDDDVTCLEISMDGSILLIGDSHGKVYATEIFSKQVLKTLQALTTSQTLHGQVTNILVNTYSTEDNDKLANGFKLQKNNNNMNKLPALQRVIFDKLRLGQPHDIWHQIGEVSIEQTSSAAVTPLSNFESYLSNLQSQETAFVELSGVSSDVTVVGGPNDTPENTSGDKQKEIDDLKQNVASLTQAYQELRQIHEKLYKEHEQLKK